ncbi:UNVERIFIED_CONTAM: hypothetical protein Slati_1504900 [Sesamum latifolium]|uniref:Uncharacterized protein n=1 Tax=Sesamum latifolium TaxID=2727402 RepID=A0AAW2X5X0_9LAMI
MSLLSQNMSALLRFLTDGANDLGSQVVRHLVNDPESQVIRYLGNDLGRRSSATSRPRKDLGRRRSLG